VEKPNELIRMGPPHLLAHARCLADFTHQEVAALKFQNLRTTTLERILRFTLKVYEKFMASNYGNEVERANI
jgi:hypothetical protein